MTSGSKRWLTAVLSIGLLLAEQTSQAFCPGCDPGGRTLTEEINSMDVVVIARVAPAAEKPKTTEGQVLGVPNDVARTKFEILQVIKGAAHLGTTKEIEVLYFGQQPKGTKFLIFGFEPPQISWNAPVPLTDAGVAYLGKLLSAPDKGADRLAYFQKFLEDKDEMLARDAYDEFAKAPYEDVKGLKDRMRHDDFVKWILDEEVVASRKRLYLVMLGICGKPADIAMLENLITKEQETGVPRTALDQIIACYITLKGPEALPLIEELFLKNKKAPYTDTYSAIMALRFHLQEENIIPKPRLIAALRHMLDRPDVADLIIADLARWEDWSAMDRLVQLFKEAEGKSSWIRVPVIQYLRACPLEKAEEHIAELEKIDPEAVKRASFFIPLAGSNASRGATKDPPAPAASTNAAQSPANATVPKSGSSTAPAASGAVNKKPAEQPNAPAAKPVSGQSEDGTAENSRPASNPMYVVFVPLSVGMGLMLLLGVVVRGAGNGNAADSRRAGRQSEQSQANRGKKDHVASKGKS